LTHHTLPASPGTVHWGHFDAALRPVLSVRSGDTITIESVNGGRDVTSGASSVLPEHAEIIERVPQKMGPHILTGPVRVEGAMPGDTLEVRIERIELRQDWGFNQIHPLKGSLPEDFPLRNLVHIPIDRAKQTAKLPWGPEIPLRPFFGILAVAPRPSYGCISSVEPREFGGNIDNKELVEGTTLLLPVQAEGALFSAGDGHAVQGDGEVCLTALETALTGTFRLTLHKGMSIAMPRAVTATHLVTHGFDPDLDDAAKQALREMIAWLTDLEGWRPVDAYVTCSLACDLRVTQIVDGNKGIHGMFPLALLSERALAKLAAFRLRSP
jgi:acetamidase/formamidase